MPWNSTWPVGSISVKANRVVGQQNTTYIETTMGNSVVGTNTNTTRDHFWNVGGDEDGRHRFIQSLAFTVGGNPTDPVLGSGMNAVLYLKTINNSPQWFTRPAAGNIYQISPNYLVGTTSVSSSSNYSTVVSVPNNTYGQIFMWLTDGSNGKFTAQTGFFKATGGVVDSWAINYQVQGSGTADNALKFGNGSEADNLNIVARRSGASSSQTGWSYKITYRAI